MSQLKPETESLSGRKYLSIKTVAEILSMSPGAVYQLIYRREIPFYKFGRKVRVREDELYAFMEEKRVEADPRVAEAMTISNRQEAMR